MFASWPPNDTGPRTTTSSPLSSPVTRVTPDQDELVSTVILLIAAGHETTTNLIGSGVLTLLQHPDQLERLRADSSLAPTAVEEILRFEPPVQATFRLAGEEMIERGKRIEPGQDAMFSLAAETGIHRRLRRPMTSISPGARTATSRSAEARISASALRWRGWRAASR